MEKWQLCLCSFVAVVAAQSDYVGTACRNSGEPGICVYVYDCPPALQAIKIRHNHTFKRCAFDHTTEIVCCPEIRKREPEPVTDDDDDDDYGKDKPSIEEPDQQNRFPKRRCEQVCEEISNEVSREVHFNIIGGDNAQKDEFPHMAALGYASGTDMQWDCGASLISERFLLTAAHCLTRSKPSVARLGVTKLDEEYPIDVPIKRFTIHHAYSIETKHSDIALIELTRQVEYSKRIRPACLYTEPDDPVGLLVTGWGKTSIGNEDDRSNILQKATLIATSPYECNETYAGRSMGLKTIDSTQICAAANQTDSCWGDSGGPLQIALESGAYSIVGIISYGAGCGGKAPGVYTRVYKYLDWIEKYVWPR